MSETESKDKNPYDIVMRYTMAQLEEARKNPPVVKYNGLSSQICNAYNDLRRRIGRDGQLLWPKCLIDDCLFLVPTVQLKLDVLELLHKSWIPTPSDQILVFPHLGDYFMLINKQVFDPRYMLNHLYKDAVVCVLTPEGWEKQNK